MHPAAARHRLLLTILMVLVQVALLPAQAHWRCMLRTGTVDCCCAPHGTLEDGDSAAPASCCSERLAPPAPDERDQDAGGNHDHDDDAGGDDAGDDDDDCCCGNDEPLHFAPSDHGTDGDAPHDLPPLPTATLPPAAAILPTAAPLQQRTNARVRLARPPTGPPLYLRYRFFLS